jgi:AGZA family xanthine/uracil permease-like MFS transporter
MDWNERFKDTTGTLYSMVKFAGLRDPVTLDFENSTIAYCVDAFSISMGALVGTSPVTAFIESATGIAGTPFPSITSYHRGSDAAHAQRAVKQV